MQAEKPTSQSQSQLPIAWMDQYFQCIGDKWPDKEGIFLPACLTEKKMFEITVEELYQGNELLAISYSTFCNVILYRVDFKNVMQYRRYVCICIC